MNMTREQADTKASETWWPVTRSSHMNPTAFQMVQELLHVIETHPETAWTADDIDSISYAKFCIERAEHPERF